MAIGNPRQITAQNIDGKRGTHKHSAYPEPPITMHPSPVRPWIGFPSAVAVSFWVVLVSSHFSSNSDEYSPLRAALLQSAR
jgi:hypothetical protein